jgi:hypothetical protein
MKRWLFAAIACSVASMVVMAQADTWGDSVGGLQLQLSIAQDSAQPKPGELPTLAGRIRNRGDGIAWFVPAAVSYGEVEVDGVWYRQIKIAVSQSSQPITAWNATATIPFSVNLILRGPDGDVVREWTPGRHVLRLRTREVNDSNGRPVRLISNALAVIVPGP